LILVIFSVIVSCFLTIAGLRLQSSYLCLSYQ
jgi:hypothetical protein